MSQGCRNAKDGVEPARLWANGLAETGKYSRAVFAELSGGTVGSLLQRSHTAQESPSLSNGTSRVPLRRQQPRPPALLPAQDTGADSVLSVPPGSRRTLCSRSVQRPQPGAQEAGVPEAAGAAHRALRAHPVPGEGDAARVHGAPAPTARL